MISLSLRFSIQLRVAVLAALIFVHRSFAAEAPKGDDVLREAVPENAIPQLKEILARAWTNAPRVIASGLDYEQSQMGVKYARSPLLPNASASVNYGVTFNQYDYESYFDPNRGRVDPETGQPVFDPQTGERVLGDTVASRTSTGIQQTLSYNAGLSQPVYHWGALKKGYQSAQLQRAIAERNIVETRRLLAIDVRRAYFNLIITANARDTEQRTLANLEKEWEFLKQQVADGFITASIASTAETRVKDHKLLMRRSEVSYDSQWRAFRQLAGLEDSFPNELPREIPPVSKNCADVVQNLSDGYGDNMPISLLNAEDAAHSERLNYEIYKTRLRPKLGVSLNASQGYNTPDNIQLYGGPYVLTSVGAYATVNWSIFDGFYSQALAKSSLIRLRQLRNSRDQLERDYRESLRAYTNNLRFNWEPLLTSETSLTGYRSSAETFQKDYESGFGTKKAWDDAKTLADNALQSANSARASYYMDIVNYLSLRGKDPAVNPATGK